MFEMAVALMAVGGLAGILAGLFGVGGGMVLVPAFYYAFTSLGYAHDKLMQICLATSLATIVVTSLRCSWGSARSMPSTLSARLMGQHYGGDRLCGH